MRSFGFRLPVFVAILWAGIHSSVWALGYHGDTVETVYVMPSTATLAVPTSSVVSSSWVLPTAYVVPSSYSTAYSTTYWTDPLALVQPTYLSTAYVRTGLFGRRRLVERPVIAGYTTTLLPTSYYLSTTYRPRYRASTVVGYPVLWESSYTSLLDCTCPTVVASTAPSISVPRSGASRSDTGMGSRSVESEVTDGSMRSDVGPPPGETASGAETATARPGTEEAIPRNPQGQPTGRDNTPTPPPPPAAQAPTSTQPAAPDQTPQQREPGATQLGTPKAAPKSATDSAAGGTPVRAPVAPAPAPDQLGPLNPADDNLPGTIRREARRPANLAPTLRPERRGVFFAKVQSGASGEAEEGVRITLTNQSDSTINRAAMTNAFGWIAMRLGDGDWTVKVTMPSGRVYPVGQIRVSNGQITDPQGTTIPSLEITR
jgi:hypothetical protein